ncbi:type 1 glutamine amidotransferase [Phenylobacterium sp. LjRoot219]|uniref:glutamine amidotransferase-related protein n=1 Tax=Phenylobacterium sp. LjRoot219 TaxID=3342283 RepID=UPI003ECDE154
MRLGILKTGAPPRGVDQFGSYPDMFRQLLGEGAYEYADFAVDEGELPARPEACDAYLVTGSSSGVYDGTPWIGELMGFLNAAKGRAALVGICFGHQVMAQAFGGKVIKSPKGWGVGEQTYDVLRREPWMDEVAQIRLPGSHQDQVVEKPPAAEVFAACDFTPFGALAYRDQPAISLQLHPEFEPDYAIALIENRRGKLFSDQQADQAVASYQAPDDRARVGGWIRDFLARTAG